MLKFKTFSMEHLEAMKISKKELFDLMEVNVTVDFALPQDWLNFFIKVSNLSYQWVIATTFYAYPPEHSFGIPISGCTEVDQKICSYIANRHRPFESSPVTLPEIVRSHNQEKYKLISLIDVSRYTLKVANKYINALEAKLIANKISMPELPVEEYPQDPLSMIKKTLEKLKKED